MKYFFVSSLALCLVSLCHSQPKISILGGKKIDLGVVNAGDTVVKRLTLKNIGNKTLRIAAVRTSCGCTVAQPASNILAPRKSTSFVVKFDTKSFSGPVKKNVYVFSNDPKDSVYTLSILASVRRIIEVEPGYVNFNSVAVDSMTKRTVVLRNTSDMKVQIYSVSCTDSQVALDLRNYIIEPHGKVSLEVTLRPKIQGKIVGEIELETDNSKLTNFTISYIAYSK